MPGRVKDYIAVPKPNGYQSLHTAVFTGRGNIVEVQVRTQEMHEFAEYGVASHHDYKRLQGGSHAHFDWVNELSKLQTQDGLNPDDYLKELRTDFFMDRIFAMTPAGDVIDLPVGATALDFAFAVHTELGLTASGAKINGSYKALKTKLNNEDIVEIDTNKNVSPKRDWLDWTVTNNAQSKIRNKLGLQKGKQREPRKSRKSS